MNKEMKDFVEIYRKNMGIMTAACKAASIGRTTIFRWRKENEEFDKALCEVLEERKDFAENAMLRKIQAGDTACILFYLKTQCRDRGYIERSEVALDTAVDEDLKELARKFYGGETKEKKK